MIEQAFREVKERAEELYKVDLSQMKLRVDMRGRCMGEATVYNDNSSLIRLSIEGCSKFRVAMISDTIPHEIAHVVASLKGSTGHSKLWKSICITLGGLGETLHYHALTPAVRQFRYENINGTIDISIVRHNKLQRGKVPWYDFETIGVITSEHLIGEIKHD